MPETEQPRAAEGRQVRQCQVFVQRTVRLKDGEEASATAPPEVISVHVFATTPAMVRIEIPIKKGRNFSSAGITLGVELPCYVEEIPQAIEKVYDIVTTRLHADLPEVLKLVDKLTEV